ncbi:MAG: virulence protein RhuM/Fic/DOC family protein [Candidatus Gastranaerophilales bacterium]|nr:virulence protein RhuM/Fic/DOC family protein [Candidatus Gastranaerophilales bacterium]
MNSNGQNEIIIYQAKNGKTQIDVKLQDETVWLTQKQMAELFDKNVRTVNEHINNIFKEGELNKIAVIRNFRITAIDGKQYDTNFYNLDVIISVGYRVKSLRGTQFRIWANSILKDYLVKGYAVNEKVLQTQREKITALQTSINLLSRSLTNQIETVDAAQQVAIILDKFAKGLDLLDNFDHKTLDTKGETKREAIRISTKEFLSVVNKMKSEFASDVFANPKDDSFDSSVNQIYQTFDGTELYPTLEEKASMLLYLITKNHSFSDGNKRIAASCFLYFLDKNDILYKNNLPTIDNATLFALTILIAESNPTEMETMKQIVVSVLNG